MTLLKKLGIKTKPKIEKKELTEKEKIIQQIENYHSYAIDSFAWKKRDEIPRMYREGELTEEELTQACKEYILKQATESFRYCASNGLDPEHHSDEKILAYGIRSGLFTSELLSELKFDHGETVDSFTKTYYRKDLAEKMAKNFIAPKDPWAFLRNSKSDSDYDPHPVCLGCC